MNIKQLTLELRRCHDRGKAWYFKSGLLMPMAVIGAVLFATQIVCQAVGCTVDCYDCVYAECGNGVVNEFEDCDDANSINDDNCSNFCTLPVCGDGIIQTYLDEQCDPGTPNGYLTCNKYCDTY